MLGENLACFCLKLQKFQCFLFAKTNVKNLTKNIEFLHAMWYNIYITNDLTKTECFYES